MKKMINKPEDLVSELLEGFSLAFPDKIKMTDNRIITRTTPKAEGKVALVTLGGCGHEPGLSGFVGHGILDVSVPGEIFAAPAPDRCLDAIKMADRGAGVLFVVLNHAGDVLTANYTMVMARKQEPQCPHADRPRGYCLGSGGQTGRTPGAGGLFPGDQDRRSGR